MYPRGDTSRQSHASDAGTSWIMPITPQLGLCAVDGGIRTPKERTSTACTVPPGRLPMSSLGMMTRGLEQGRPSDSGVCSHMRQVASGTQYMLKNSSGCGGCMLMRSYKGLLP